MLYPYLEYIIKRTLSLKSINTEYKEIKYKKV
jgi:hypothetical protein